MKTIQLHIGDVAVALGLSIAPSTGLKSIAESTARSLGEVHNAIRRLTAGHLIRPETRQVEREPLLRFIRWGVPHAFPPSIGPITRGVATARFPESGNATEPSEAEFVWPDPGGQTRGQAFAPPYPRATKLQSQNPELRVLLALLDLVRVGGLREQAAALDEIGRRLVTPVG